MSLAGRLAAVVLFLSQAEREGSWCQSWGSCRPGQAQKSDDISSEQDLQLRDPCHLCSLSDPPLPPPQRAAFKGETLK